MSTSPRPRWPLAVGAAAFAIAAGCSSQRLRSALDHPAQFTTTTSTDPAITLPPAITSTTTIADTTTSGTTATTSPPTTVAPTTTTSPLLTEGAIVMVANASGVDGAAKTLAADLAARGYISAKVVNAAGIEEDLDTSKVYYLAAGEAAARSIAAVMGNLAVAAMPTPAWIVGATAALGDANVLVMLGHDLAGVRIPGISPD